MTDERDVVVPVSANADVAVVHRRARGFVSAVGLRFSSSELTRIMTALSEVARNIVTYAGRGEIILRLAQGTHRRGLAVIATDCGPGIADIERAMQDGFSTRGSLGLGLPGCKRLMDEFDIASRLGKGTVVMMTKWEHDPEHGAF